LGRAATGLTGAAGRGGVVDRPGNQRIEQGSLRLAARRRR